MDLDFVTVAPRDGLEKPTGGEEYWPDQKYVPDLDNEEPKKESPRYQDFAGPRASWLVEVYPNPVLNKPYQAFWLDDPTVLISEPYLFPSDNMTLNQKLNSIVRGSFVFAIATYFLSKSRKALYIAVAGLLISAMVYMSKNLQEAMHPAEFIRREAAMKKIQETLKKVFSHKQPDHLTKEDAKKLQKYVPDAISILEDSVGKIQIEKNKDNENDENAENGASEVETEPDMSVFDVPADYDWDPEKLPNDSRDVKNYASIDVNWEAETRGRNEQLLTYGDMLNTDFEDILTSDLYDPSRENANMYIDRDIYHPRNRTGDGATWFDPW